jgi:hypothetical protein
MLVHAYVDTLVDKGLESHHDQPYTLFDPLSPFNIEYKQLQSSRIFRVLYGADF